MIRNPKIAIILLAAGSSERMQKNKLMLDFNGKSLLENTLLCATRSGADTVSVVLGAFEEMNETILKKFQVEKVFNENWQKGIGASIKSGVKQSLLQSPDLNALIISVCDQPYLTKNIFDGLIATYRKTGKKIVASEYAKTIGVPVLYDKSLFDKLLNIPDQQGAKRTLINWADEKIITTFPFPKGEIDIDTEEDFRSLPRPKDRGY